MNATLLQQLAGVVALVALAWVAACAETALSRVSRFTAEDAVREGRRGAERLLVLAEDHTRYFNLTLLIRMICEMGAAVLITVACVGGVRPLWRGGLLAVLITVLVSYVAIGVSPRTVGRQHPLSVSIAAAAVLVPLARVLGPLPKLLIVLGNALTPGKGFREGPFASEAELRSLVDLAEANAVIEEEERRMVHSVFELGDTIVREVMVPRTDMVDVEQHKTVRQALTLALRSGFSRIPVIDGGQDDVVGIVYLKDLSRRVHISRAAESEPVSTVMRPATFVPDSKPAADLLREMQRDRIHMAVVVDEYGGTAGLITIEDILEEIVGEIADEYDRAAPSVEPLPDGAFRVTARLPVDEFGELFGLEWQDEDVDTVGGLLGKALGKVPIPGATVVVDGIRLTAESAAGRRNRIGTVLAERVPQEPSEAPDGRDDSLDDDGAAPAGDRRDGAGADADGTPAGAGNSPTGHHR
ncbi:hemolysin family protein [Allostreptomyces psammosilenae]|uniref:CBS domain containing-hemolysin-like protein n=1 Tax=Allostreptomyces psammosilenae TaxID=1892865 RepID=A0A853A819_9ACTN|nr:hemolysin family protein [Allostreptomyces psammosilenae]NYI06678.1 CBS domain containing-hemolysin-like protein [Allostreptomyces psammosilenae]